ncbi:MAG: aldehyde ferredoxin oxidoreductase N-terminal domain-containing protein [Desulforegulaceae bacterium]|nr:aldehyde ferredoxin oxidoreductase N-terminal domain-containing protein [Desulforegulaceae bacterium]
MAKKNIGISNKVLEVDLSSRTWNVFEVSREERKLYIGAKGLGLKLLFDRINPGIDPLSEKNILSIVPGILTDAKGGCSGWFYSVAKSPLTNLFNSSFCNGSFGVQLRTAGWDGLIIKGRSRKHIILKIDKNGAYFEDGEAIWGFSTKKSQEKLVKGKNEAALVIGPAGENGVKFANIRSGNSFFGKEGLGAVMGSKNLKGVVVKGGDYKILPANKKKLNKLRKKANKYTNQNQAGSYLFKSFKPESSSDLGEIFSEIFTKRKPYKVSSEDKKSLIELGAASVIGTNLKTSDSSITAKFNEICSKMGMDTILAGRTIGWIMGSSEKCGLDFQVKTESYKGIEDFLYEIAYSRGEGVKAGLGLEELLRQYNQEDFTTKMKIREMDAFMNEALPDSQIDFHDLNSGSFSFSFYEIAIDSFFRLLKIDNLRSQPGFIKLFENVFCAVNSLGICCFTSYFYARNPVLLKYCPKLTLNIFVKRFPALAISLVNFSLYSKLFTALTGIKLSRKDFLKAGERIHKLEKNMNIREYSLGKKDVLKGRGSQI